MTPEQEPNFMALQMVVNCFDGPLKVYYAGRTNTMLPLFSDGKSHIEAMKFIVRDAELYLDWKKNQQEAK